MGTRQDHEKQLFLILTLFIYSAKAAIIHVAPTGGHDATTCGDVLFPCATLQYAISDRAVSGDTVLAMPGVHRGPFGPPGNLGFGIELSGKTVTVTGRGAVVDCQGSGRGFHITGGRPALILTLELYNPNSHPIYNPKSPRTLACERQQ